MPKTVGVLQSILLPTHLEEGVEEGGFLCYRLYRRLILAKAIPTNSWP